MIQARWRNPATIIVAGCQHARRPLRSVPGAGARRARLRRGHLGLPAEAGAYAIALIGLFNICGAFFAGVAGQRWQKKYTLETIYVLRALAITGLMLASKTVATIYLFASVMGVLWLSTVALTSGIVAQVSGVRYMATLFGVVFFSHQLGSLAGVWLGGFL